MKLRLNLLKEEEIRYPGQISRKLAIRLGIVAAVLLVAALVGGLFLQGRVVRARMERIKAELKKIDAPFQIARGMQKDLALNQATAEDLKGWERGRLSSADLLKKLQAIVPPEMELSRFSLFSQFRMIPPPAWKKDVPPTPGIACSMRIEGRVISAFAETVVVEFLRTLKSAAGYGDLVESVKLERLHRDPTVGKGQEARVFSVLVQLNVSHMVVQEAAREKKGG